MRKVSIKKNAILNVIYSITNMIFPLITYPYVTRVLSATGMGKVSFFTSVSNYAVMIGSLGISTYGIRATAKVRDDKAKLSQVTEELFILNSIITTIVVLALVISIPFVTKFNSDLTIFIINILIILSAPIGMNWLYSGLEQYSYITKRNMIIKAISLISVFVFVKDKNDYAIYALITALSTIIAYVCNFVYARKFITISLEYKLEFKKHLRPMLLLFSSILAVSVYTNLDTIMLGFIKNDAEVGYYNIANKIEQILLTAVNAISAVLLPRLSNYIEKKEFDKYNNALRKSFEYIVLISIPISVYFIIDAADCIYLLGGKGYEPAILCMQILMPIIIISGISNVIGNQILIPNNNDSEFMKAVVAGAITDLVLNAVLMPNYGCVGGSIATLIAEFVQMSVQFGYSINVCKRNIHFKVIIKTLISVFFASFLVLIYNNFVHLHYIVNLVLTFVIYVIVILISLILLREENLLEILKSIKKKAL